MNHLQFAINILLLITVIILVERHKREIQRVYKEHQDERQALLDRIMSNNIHEFKSANGQTPIKRSISGNFLMDRMKKTLGNRFDEIDE